MEFHNLDLSREEREALRVHLGHGPMWNFPTRCTVWHALKLKVRFRQALPPHELPELDTPLWHAMMKIKRVAEVGRVHHRNVHDMMYTMSRLGGKWIALPDPVERSLGFAREDGSCCQAIYLYWAKEAWRMRRGVETGTYDLVEWDVPEDFRRKFRTPAGRDEIARILSTGDHCLEFHEEDVYPLLARYIENGGHL